MSTVKMVGLAFGTVIVAVGVMIAFNGARGTAASLPTGLVTSHEIVSPTNRDTMDPLPAGVSPAVSTDSVVATLRRDSYLAPYLSDPTHLTIRLGLYNNPNLSRPAVNVTAYVITGGQAPCVAGGAFRPGPASAARHGICTAVIVADASTGKAIVFHRTGPL
jgi:hypothetical protein